MGSDPHHLTERIDEMALIIKAQPYRHIQRIIIFTQLISGLEQTQLHMVLQRRHADVLAEQADKVKLAQSADLRQRIEMDFAGQMVTHKIERQRNRPQRLFLLSGGFFQLCPQQPQQILFLIVVVQRAFEMAQCRKQRGITQHAFG